MPASSPFVIEPPAQTRFRESSADPKTVEGMAAAINPETWVSDGKTYNSNKEAANEGAVYRRALARALNVEPHKLKSKTWGMKDGVILTDKAAPGEWRFAYTVDPNRQKRTRKSNGS